MCWCIQAQPITQQVRMLFAHRGQIDMHGLLQQFKGD
jgi:hypothetical protein